MTPRQQALALIEEHGADLNLLDADGLQGDVYAPSGKIWNSSGCHLIALAYKTNRPAGWRYLLEELRSGMAACETPDCEVCDEEPAG